MILRALTAAFVLAALGGCGRGTDETTAEASHADEEIDATVLGDDAGAIHAILDYASGYTQVVKGSATSRIAAARLSFPPGFYDIDLDVYLEEGPTLATKKVLSQLVGDGVNVVAMAPSVLYYWPYDEDMLQPVTAMIPEAKAEAGASGTLVVLYVKNVPGTEEQVFGVMKAEDFKVAADLARFSSPTFGIFQSVLLSAAPSAAKEIKTSEPIVPSRGSKAAPGAFTFKVPAGDYLGAHVVLSWDGADDARSYDVLADLADPKCGTPYAAVKDFAGTTHAIDLKDGESYLCVVAKNAAGSTGATNNGVKVKVDGLAPAVPAKPTGPGAKVSSISFKFTWTAVADVGPAGFSHYEVEIYKVSGNELIFTGPVVDKTEYNVLGYDNESYIARVKAIDTVGNESEWSAFSDPVLIDSTP